MDNKDKNKNRNKTRNRKKTRNENTTNPDPRLDPFPNVKKMLAGLPPQLRDILLPKDDNGMFPLEARTLALRIKEIEREKVMSIQRLCGFPLRPNQPLHEAQALARIQGLKKSNKYNKFKKKRNNRNNDGPIF